MYSFVHLVSQFHLKLLHKHKSHYGKKEKVCLILTFFIPLILQVWQLVFQ